MVYRAALADEDSQPHQEMSRFVLLAVDAVLVEGGSGHLLFKVGS